MSGILGHEVGRFATIELDLPWDGREKGCHGWAGVQAYEVDAASKYDVMSLSDMEDFGRQVIADHSEPLLDFWMWTTDLFLDDSFRLIEAWGLARKRTHIWVKTTDGLKKTQAGLKEFSRQELDTAEEVMWACGIPGKPNPKTGYWGKLGHEYLHLCTNHSGRRTLNATRESSVFYAPAKDHSCKPDIAYEIIARNSPGPRASLFQRYERDGFWCWGNQLKED